MIAVNETVLAIPVQSFSRRAGAGHTNGVKDKIGYLIKSGSTGVRRVYFRRRTFAMQYGFGRFMHLAALQPFITQPHVPVGNQRINVVFGELFERVLAVETGVGGDDGLALQQLLVAQAFGDIDNHAVLGTVAPGLGVDNDLVLIIHRGQPGVALNNAFLGRHFGAVVIGEITLAGLAAGAGFIVRMFGEPLAQLSRLFLQTRQFALGR